MFLANLRSKKEEMPFTMDGRCRRLQIGLAT